MSAAVYLEAPLVRTPRKGGLFRLAQVTDFATPHEAAGVDWTPSPCGPAALAPGVCDSVIEVPDDDKVFDGVPYASAGPFGVYKGIECDLRSNWEERALQALELGEPSAVELGVQTAILNQAEFWSATPMPPELALGGMEAALMGMYGGEGLIHVSAVGGAILASRGLIEWDPVLQAPRTKASGTPVAVSAIYDVGPGNHTPGLGQFWIYATGQVFLRRGRPVVRSAPDVQTNTMRALAERIWVAAAECMVVAQLADSNWREGS